MAQDRKSRGPALIGGVIALVAAFAALTIALAQQPDGASAPSLAAGEPLFKAHCASCHDPAVGRAPDRERLKQLGILEIINALRNGSMRPMAVGLTALEQGEIAAYLSPPSAPQPASAPPDPPKCAKVARFSMRDADWPTWGHGVANRRDQPSPGVAAGSVAKLKVKWAFAEAGGKTGQPTVAGGRVFLTSFGGSAYALDASSGCLIWKIDGARSRTTIAVGPLSASPSGYAAFFGDATKSVRAVDAEDGKPIWSQNIETHPLSILTGAPVLYQGKLYAPVSSFEELTASQGKYPCCTFRGSVVALDAATGKLLWKTYTISQPPAPSRKNSAGTQMFGPAGGAVWSAPTIDPKRGVLYVATGDSYTDEQTDGADAVIAIDLATGAVRWRTQVTPGDNYLSGCESVPLVNCPTQLGRDFDFGAPPILVSAGGRDVLLAGQKSGFAYGLDPASGKVLWKTKVGAGGALGGIEWGMASDGRRLYVGNADAFMPSPPGRPGLAALDPATGQQLWFSASPHLACGWIRSPCLNGISAPPTVIPGLVFAGDLDGRLRAYAADDGKIVWEVDTGSTNYPTVNGVSELGGNLDGPGPVVAGGMLYVMSGYQGSLGGPTTSALLAFSVDGR